MHGFPDVDYDNVTPEVIMALSEELRSDADEVKKHGSDAELARLADLVELAIIHLVATGVRLSHAKDPGKKEYRAIATDFLLTWAVVNQVGRSVFDGEDTVISRIDAMLESGRGLYLQAEAAAYEKEN